MSRSKEEIDIKKQSLIDNTVEILRQHFSVNGEPLSEEVLEGIHQFTEGVEKFNSIWTAHETDEDIQKLLGLKK